MAVTLTGAQLAAALRLGSSAMETAMVERLLASGTAEIERHLGGAYDDCPEAIVNEALIRLAGHRYDSPTTRFANSLRSSGAAGMLLPWRHHGAGVVSEVEE